MLFFNLLKTAVILLTIFNIGFIKNMISGASQADVALLLVPADGNFVTSLQRGNHKEGEVQGQTRQHALLLNLLGVKQLIVAINKMDDKTTANYSKARYDEVAEEMRSMLIKVGWKKEFVTNSIPMIPLSGFNGDNLIDPSPNMDWWKGVDVKVGDRTAHVHTLMDALEKFVEIPERNVTGLMRTPISGVFKIKGVGDIITGRVEQGKIFPSNEVVFLPTHTDTNRSDGKIFSIEMHHKTVAEAGPGDNVGMNIKNLNKDNMPRVGDIMVLKSDLSIKPCKSFVAQVKVLEHPGELKPGYSPIGFVRTSRSAVKMTKIHWKIGKATGGVKLEDPPFVLANEMAELTFEPQQPFVLDTFKNSEGLGRIAILEGGSVVMLGKVISVEF